MLNEKRWGFGCCAIRWFTIPTCVLMLSVVTWDALVSLTTTRHRLRGSYTWAAEQQQFTLNEHEKAWANISHTCYDAHASVFVFTRLASYNPGRYRPDQRIFDQIRSSVITPWGILAALRGRRQKKLFRVVFIVSRLANASRCRNDQRKPHLAGC